MSDPEREKKPPPNPAPSELTKELQEAAQIEASAVQPNDPLAAAGERILQLEEKILRLEHLSHDLRVEKDRHKLRVPYIDRLYWLTVIWLLIVIIFLSLQATVKKFNLSDSVLIAFITSTTVSVIGLFVLVGKWLFPSSEKKETESKKE
jgi:hypothetical protein